MEKNFKLWISGRWQEGQSRDVMSPYSQAKVATVHEADSKQIEEALATTVTAFEKFRKSSRYARSRLLAAMAQGLSENRALLTQMIIDEAGKPFSASDIEVTRAIGTFTVASEETKRLSGDITPVDIDPGGKPFGPALSYWLGRGPVFGICPFNFPLNLVAHKLAPALAAGVSIIIKTPPQAPGCATFLAQLFEKAIKDSSGALDEIPLGTLQILHCSNDLAEKAATDRRIQTLSFTGSAKVGWHLQSKAVGKKVILELGGNAAVIIHEDADLKRAASRCAVGGYTYAGQTCISVQRIFVHEKIKSAFLDLFLNEVDRLPVGDPAQKTTVVGPIIDKIACDRIETWVNEAQKNGAKILKSGKRDGNLLPPLVITNASTQDKIVSEEIFGPLVVVDTYSEFSEAVKKVNDSKYGLQAGVFTDSSKIIHYAIENLDVGGVIINEASTFRADNMPYGGVKESGLGREGVRFAMEEMSERRTVVHWNG